MYKSQVYVALAHVVVTEKKQMNIIILCILYAAWEIFSFFGKEA